MPPGLPARVVVVCTLMFGVAIAHAERRPVAVIDLSNDTKTVALAKDLNPELQNHADLRPIPDAEIVPELFGEFRDDDQQRIENALNSKKTAETRLAAYDFSVAEQNAHNGQMELEQAMPSTSSLALYSQLAFVRAQALLGMPKQSTEARAQFALAHRLDPAFVPDAARYLPDVVQAFDAAKTAWPGKGTLAIVGNGRLWIDGKDAGTAPTELELDAGPHVVWLTGADRVTSAQYKLVDAVKKTKLEIADAPATARLKVRRARAQLRYAPDPAARAAAMRMIAELVKVRDAVLLTSVNGKVVVQTWNAGTRDQTPGFSPFRELKNEKPIDLLTPLAPPKPKPDEIKQPTKDKPIIDERRWYQRRTVQASIAIGVIAAIVAGYYIYQAATDDTVLWDNDLTQGVTVRW